MEGMKLQTAVTNELMCIGVNPGTLGFTYLEDAIALVYTDPDYITSMTKRLYPGVADKRGTTASRVERAIRHSVERTFDNPGSVAYDYFGSIVDDEKGKVTNTTFIATVAKKLHIKEAQNNE